jgi:ribosomal protein S18 acetylase RimI-like enzyme
MRPSERGARGSAINTGRLVLGFLRAEGAQVKIAVIESLPLEFETLLAESIQDGHHFLGKMKDEWASGKNRFDREGEILFAVHDGKQNLAAIGGLNVDPYAQDHAVARIRHLYVGVKYRRQGLGRLLLERLLAQARGRFSLLRLRTNNPAAVEMYERVGFLRVGDQDGQVVMEMRLV